MKIFGFDVSFKKALSGVSERRGGWWPIIFESFPGAWQQNVVVDRNLVLAHHAVYACITLIATDIAKLQIMLVQKEGDIWVETTNPAYSPVIRRPNNYQNRIQFFENWILSKLMRGNTYVLKGRDNRNVVNRFFILDPARVRPLVSDSGEIFYELDTDNLAGLSTGGERVIVPAMEIIHDRMNCLFHPLVGTSPIYAAGLAAWQGLKIQEQSAWFFGNKSMPGGVLTAPGAIADETAARLKASWDTNFAGENAGKVAVLGDGLKFDKMPINAEESQLIEQLKWSGDVVCSVFHVPPYKIGLGTMPTYNNIQSLNTEYYSQCLQGYIEAMELCLDEGLALAADLGIQVDLSGLLRMDTATQVTSLKEAVAAGVMSPNEARRKLDLKPVKGGESPYLQQQNYSLEALAERGAPPAASAAAAPAPPEPAPPEPSAGKQLDFRPVAVSLVEELWTGLSRGAA